MMAADAGRPGATDDGGEAPEGFTCRRIAQIQGIERTNTLTAFRVYSKQDLGAAWDMFD